MNRSTRYFLVGSAFIIVLGLGTGLVATYSGNMPLGLLGRDDAQLGYIPADAAAVGYADVRAIMSSEFRQKVRQMLPSGEELAKIQQELGVDVEHDIDSVSAAYLGGASEKSGVVVVHGRFNDVQIETLATQHGAVASEYKGKRLLTMNPAAEAAGADGHQGEHATATVAFLEPGVLAMGQTSAVQRAIDAGGSGADIRKNAELTVLIDDMRGVGNAWFVGQVGALTDHTALPDEIAGHLSAINLVAMSVHVNGGVRGTIRAEARDDEAAGQLRDIAKGALAAAHLMAGQNPKMDAMLTSLQITGSGKTVGMNFSVPLELLDIINGIAAGRELGTGAMTIHK